ncbi:MAG: sulfite exporter TauE/SafE family protein [Burkholderiaceae bacterium]|nr:sulfite exporter TauE/SafE family protein [Burkholderiaceae bacterium]
MDWYLLVPACLVSGALIGFTGGVLGIGGGLLAIPLLGLLLGMDQQTAQGTALIMVLPAVLISVWQYNKNAKIDLGAAAAAACSSVVFTWLGAQLALGLDPVLLRRLYALFVFLIAIFYFHQSGIRIKPRKRQLSRRSASEFHKGWFALVGILAGLAGGVFGVGGSVLVVPLLTTFFRLPQTGAQALGLTMIMPGILVALITYSAHGYVDWTVGLPMALGSVFLVPYGVRLAYSLPEPRLKLIFACMLLVIMVLLLLKA